MTNKKQVLASRKHIIQSYLAFTLANASEVIERQFALFSANIYHMLPQIPPKRYLQLFRELHINRRLSFLDIEQIIHVDGLQIAGWDDAWASHVNKKPCLICTYHTGSYRLINYLLAKARVPVSLVVSAKAYRQEQVAMQQLYVSLAQETSITLDMQLINSEHNQALIQMARAIKSGRSLLIYIDGNTGATPNKGLSRNLLGIDFLSKNLAVRQGMATLAHRLHIPIYPVLCKRINYNRIHYTHFDPILPHQGEECAPFARRATQALYHLLENFVSDVPEQWEAWLYLQNFLMGDFAHKNPLDFEKAEHWVPYHLKGKVYLLHRPSYQSYPIRQADYPVLKAWCNSIF